MHGPGRVHGLLAVDGEGDGTRQCVTRRIGGPAGDGQVDRSFDFLVLFGKARAVQGHSLFFQVGGRMWRLVVSFTLPSAVSGDVVANDNS